MNQPNQEKLTEDIQPRAEIESNNGIDQLNFLGSQPDAPYFIENPFEIKNLKKVLHFTQAELTRPNSLKIPTQYMLTGLLILAFFTGAFAIAYKISTVKPLIQILGNQVTHSVDSTR